MRPIADFTSQEYLRNPAAGIARLRASGPVVEIRFPIIGKVWITTTQELAGRVLKDSQTFTLRKEGGGLAGLRWWMPGVIRALANNMLTMDEPDHTRLRSIVDEAFRRRAILDLEPRILTIAEGLADELFAEGSPADIVDLYARRVPLSVICEVLGEGLIAELVRVESEGRRISSSEVVAMVFLLLGAGTETTTHLISGSVYELLRDPKLRDWLEEDWSRANLAVEEFLRFVSPVQFTKPRFVRRDVQLDGVQLKEGEKIMAMVAAANLDPEANEHPERLDLERRPNRHLAFGTGIHFCLGHQLARIEGKCALEALFKRWPKLALAVDASQIRWRERPGLRAIAQLPVIDGA
jgi:cytochrome P450